MNYNFPFLKEKNWDYQSKSLSVMTAHLSRPELEANRKVLVVVEIQSFLLWLRVSLKEKYKRIKFEKSEEQNSSPFS